MHRFYVPNIELPTTSSLEPEAEPRRVSLDGPTARQLRSVLRVEVGERIRLFDGSGWDWEAEIDHVGKTRVSTTLIATVEPVPEPSCKVTMLLGLARPERIELAIQKCTELGAVGFVPVVSERVQGGTTGAPSAKRLERWQRIAVEAAEQSGRAIVPTVDTPLPVMDAVNRQLAAGPVLFMWEEQASESLPLSTALEELFPSESHGAVASDRRGTPAIGGLIGPPGGFSEREAQAIKQAGAQLVTLGPRVLRSETAAIAVMSAILYEMGDLGG